MAVTYERVVGRRMRVTRSKPSERLDRSKRWRRVDESTDQPGAASDDAAEQTESDVQADAEPEVTPDKSEPAESSPGAPAVGRASKTKGRAGSSGRKES